MSLANLGTDSSKATKPTLAQRLTVHRAGLALLLYIPESNDLLVIAFCVRRKLALLNFFLYSGEGLGAHPP